MDKEQTKQITNDHRKLYPEVYDVKQGSVRLQQIPSLQYVSQDMNTAFHMNWAGRPEPIDEHCMENCESVKANYKEIIRIWKQENRPFGSLNKNSPIVSFSNISTVFAYLSTVTLDLSTDSNNLSTVPRELSTFRNTN